MQTLLNQCLQMNKIWIHKAESFKDAELFDKNYYLSMSASERLDTVQFLRDQFFKIKGLKHGKSRKRLRRVLTITQQT